MAESNFNEAIRGVQFNFDPNISLRNEENCVKNFIIIHNVGDYLVYAVARRRLLVTRY